MFTSPLSFSGRIRRTEYGLSFIIGYAGAFLIGTISGLTQSGVGIMYLLLIPVLWFAVAQGAKRCHDRGNSGWFQFIPFYGFWMLFADSDPGRNVFGPNPKGIGNKYYISQEKVFVYDQMSTSSEIIAELHNDDDVFVEDNHKFGDFLKVKLPTGQDGYILRASNLI